MATWLEDAWHDTRFAIRQLRKSPGFTAVAVLTLALGIGANAAIFTLVDAVLLKPLPVRDPASLVLFGDATASGVGTGFIGRSFVAFSYDLYKTLRDSGAVAELCAVQSARERLGVRRGSGSAEPTAARLVSGNYFQVLGVGASAGRTLAPSDDAAASPPVAVASFQYWTRTLNGDPSAIGRAVDINGAAVTIVGVAPPGFYGDRIEADPPSLWLPIAASRALNPTGHLIDQPDLHWLYLIGRLSPDAAAPQTEARLTIVLRDWLRGREGAALSDERRARLDASRIELTPIVHGVPRLQRQYADSLRLLFGLSLAVLLVTCANIAGLLFARGTARRLERSVRLAIGATRGRLVRQSLTESLTLAWLGGALALVVASTATRLLVALAFPDAAYVPIQTAPDARVLVFTFALACVAAIVFGLLPALRMESEIVPGMRAVRVRWGRTLVVAEIVVSLAVLASAGALARSLSHIAGQPFGFDHDHVLVAHVDSKLARYDFAQLAPLYDRLQSRLAALPGVRSASLSYYSPLEGCCWAFSVTVPGDTPPEEQPSPLINRVSPRYFETIGTRVLRGRTFDAHDTPGSRRVIVVTEDFVQHFLPGREPIGRTVTIDSEGRDSPLEIVGVVERAKYDEPREPMRPMIFMPLFQMKAGESPVSSEYRSNFIEGIEVRSAGDPAEIAGAVRRAVAEIAPDLPVLRVETLSARIMRSMSQDSAVAMLASTFGLLVLALTTIGLYGLMAYLVQRRTGEIGVRMALGAGRARVTWMVLRDALGQAAIGTLAGIPVAFAATRMLGSQLYDVSPTDPRSAAAAAVVLVACLAAAGYVPARRAARIDPIRALRTE